MGLSHESSAAGFNETINATKRYFLLLTMGHSPPFFFLVTKRLYPKINNTTWSCISIFLSGGCICIIIRFLVFVDVFGYASGLLLKCINILIVEKLHGLLSTDSVKNIFLMPQ